MTEVVKIINVNALKTLYVAIVAVIDYHRGAHHSAMMLALSESLIITSYIISLVYIYYILSGNYFQANLTILMQKEGYK